MTPVASWTPADYHRAFNECRAAWEKTSPQLTIDGWADMLDGLDRQPDECRRLPVEPVTPTSTPPVAGSPLGAEPSRDPLLGNGSDNPHAVGLLDGGPSAPLSTTTPRPAEPDWDLRGSGQKGA